MVMISVGVETLENALWTATHTVQCICVH